MLKYTDDMTPFDMTARPSKQYFFLMPLIWIASFLDAKKFGLRIDKSGMKGIKPPYLVIATHQGPADYSAAPLAMFPRRAMFVSDMEGFEWYGKWLYRGLGCIGKRRFVSDISVVKNMKYALSKKQAVWVYPESRHSNVGTTAYIPENLGKLCKMMDVPVVLFTLYGAYLANPFWDELHTRKVPMEGKMKLLFSKEEVESISSEVIQAEIEKGLQYNEYEYQTAHDIRITEPFRAQGLHMPLYRCRKCGVRYKMVSSGDTLECRACGRKYLLREDGLLEEYMKVQDCGENPGENSNGTAGSCDVTDREKFKIPEWYEWERQLEIEENADGFRKEFNVRVEALPGEKGFVNLGTGILTMDEKEFVLRINEKSGASEELHFPHRIRESVQTEYDYRGVKGKGIVLSTRDCCYYIYCDAEDFNPTEIQFLGEWSYRKAKK